MRILFLSPRQAYPARSGAKLREYHFLRALGLSAELTYLYFAEPGAAPLTTADLPFCARIEALPKPPAYGLMNNLRGLLTRWPLPILNYTSPQMSAAVARATQSAAFDLVHLDSIHMLRYAPASARVVYNWHNIESEAMLRFSESAASPAKRAYARITAAKLEKLERGILTNAFGHIVCSEREQKQLCQIAPRARIEVVENGVDTQYFAPPSAAAPRTKIVFVGAMDYFPNADAAVHFARNIWPEVRSRLPNPELTIVGANPGPPVRALAELPGVTVTGTVPDVRPYYENALAAVVPLRTGGGTRLKILEAMAAGVPVISSPLGAEGLAVTDNQNIFLADPADPNAWAERLEAVLHASPQLSQSALQLVRTRYDWNLLGAKLVQTYRDWLSLSSR